VFDFKYDGLGFAIPAFNNMSGFGRGATDHGRRAMSSLTVGSLIFGCVFGGALLGMLLRALLPEHHFSADSKEVVKLGTGLIGTMAALVLGLLVASAKSSYDNEKSELTDMSASVLLLDRVLAHYGPEATESRALLRGVVKGAVERLWAQGHLPPSQAADTLYDRMHQLAPANETQRALLAEAQSSYMGLGRMRMLLLLEQGDSSISTPFLVIVVFWLTIIFVSFGLLAPRKATVIAALLICALSVSIAMFLILELDSPFHGLIQLSSAPLRNALSLLGQ